MPEQTPFQKQRFLRDAPPFLDGFERIVGDLMMLQKNSSEYLVPITMELVKHIRGHFDECNRLLASAEANVESARERNAPPEEIEALIGVCRGLQQVQTRLAEDVESSVNKILDQVFPR